MIKRKKKPNTEKELYNILTPVVKKWFFSKFEAFSEPQLYGVMDIHSRKNVLVSASTGSGKTLTAFLSILNELIDNSEKDILEDRIYAVYVSPLKALSRDINVNLTEPLKEMNEIAGKDLGIRVGVRTGDTTAYERQKMAKNVPHILITTPESLAIMLASPKFAEKLKEVQWCIVDEIHSLAENKRGVHLSLTLEKLGQLSSHMTRVGLSATVAPIEEVAKFLVGYEDSILRDCNVVDVQYLKKTDIRVLSPVKDLIESTHVDMQTKLYKLLNKLIQEHKTTLIFTNTRAGTERVVDNLKHKFPRHYTESNIGAHHGSLSKEYRDKIESELRDGKLKCIVSSTSLELGIDIGFIDLVILLGSPKSVSRALQRIGRSGHQLHSVSKGRIVVLDRDSLVECSVLLKEAIEKKIDRIHIPTNCLDVLAQQVYGFVIQESMTIHELYKLVRGSYCYHKLDSKDLMDVVDYLSGKFISLEDRHVYSKIYHDEKTSTISKRGKLARVMYMTNIGTIPSSSRIKVKVNGQIIGTLDEGFIEKMNRGDVFILAGSTYVFRSIQGMTLRAQAAISRPPTVPSWYSEMLPLSFDLAMSIGKFRRLMQQKFEKDLAKGEIVKFIDKYLYVDSKAANAIYEYFKEQYDYVEEFPNEKKILIEYFNDDQSKKIVFHSLYGRRVNDCLSRAIAYVIGTTLHKDVEIGISDNGFYLGIEGKISIQRVLDLLMEEDLYKLMEKAIGNSVILRRRFRHCAARALMILRSYKGRTKSAGIQQMASRLLFSAVKRIDENFFILKESKREVLEDLMDIENTKLVVSLLKDKKIKIKEIQTNIPTPFGFNLVLQGYLDIMKMDDKQEFLKRMHQMVKVKTALKGKKVEIPVEPFDYKQFWKKTEAKKEQEFADFNEKLKFDLRKAAKRLNLESQIYYDCYRLVDGDVEGFRPYFVDWLKELLSDTVPKIWTDDLVKFLRAKYEEIK
jgi:ATP-dependent helicase Lhr and Lhr-like helicase